MDNNKSNAIAPLPPRPLSKPSRLELSLEPIRSTAHGGDRPSPDADISLPVAHYVWLFRRHAWRIALFVLAVSAAALAWSLQLTPVYQATVSIDIDRQTPTGVIGQESLRAITNDSDQFLATQVKLLQSDSVLRPVVERFHLPLKKPSRFRLQKPYTEAEQRAAPMVLSGLKVSRPPNTYLIQVSYSSENPKLAADAVNAIAHSYLEHTYNIRHQSALGLSRFMEKQLEELRLKMESSSSALARFERELHVVNPEDKTNIISARLLQINQEYTTAQADRVRKEAAWKSIGEGSQAAAQVSSQAEAMRQMDQRLGEARQKLSEVQAHYGANHPEHRRALAQVTELERQLTTLRENIRQGVGIEYRQALEREEMLSRQVQETKQELDQLNARSFDYLNLRREAEADKKLYEELVRRIKEAGINSSFQNSAIRIADLARTPLEPVSPNLLLNTGLAFVLALILAIVGTLISDMLDNTLRDPEQVRNSLGVEVLGTLPEVKSWRHAIGLAKTDESSASTALAKPGRNGYATLGGYEESIRTLRNSVLLTHLDRNLRSLLVTSAQPGEGKSTVAAHFALTHALQGSRTLLVDGDMRRPSVHRRFGIENNAGFGAYLQGKAPLADLIQISPLSPDLHILTAGPASRRPDDWIRGRMDDILDQLLSTYQFVVLDAPPLLGFAEPLEMATAVDGVMVVTRAGATPRKQVASVLDLLSRLRANVLGLVLNQVNKSMSESYSYYGYYGKYYAAKERG